MEGTRSLSKMSLAYELLSDGMKKTLNGLSALCCSKRKKTWRSQKKDASAKRAYEKDAYKERENTVKIETVHPVARTHPRNW